jgi:hypothetical protein
VYLDRLQTGQETIEFGNVPVICCDEFEAESALRFHMVNSPLCLVAYRPGALILLFFDDVCLLIQHLLLYTSLFFCQGIL